MQIIYIHGAAASSQSFNWIRTRLSRHYARFVSYRLDEPIPSVIDRVFDMIREPSVLIGHSLGGVIAASCAEHVQVGKLITLCAPFGGIPYAELLAMWSSDPLFRELRHSSPMLAALRRRPITKPHLAIVGSSGLPTMTEPNDGVLTVASQTALSTDFIILPLNHFEVLLSSEVTDLIEKFIAD
jgi:pimeloyl-ACP methyl ester carboxylesterase